MRTSEHRCTFIPLTPVVLYRYRHVHDMIKEHLCLGGLILTSLRLRLVAILCTETTDFTSRWTGRLQSQTQIIRYYMHLIIARLQEGREWFLERATNVYRKRVYLIQSWDESGIEDRMVGMIRKMY
jgi:hypothetical protein